ncbi:hypothetical protein Sme01_43320 [Sphaerisporangium melleum]|nr:beta-propeller domain-containing protein [Sphaerisporangium melleum]GII71856.1 hypothetical protein Sme01_43320 [Sphaerisporangium melleum]
MKTSIGTAAAVALATGLLAAACTGGGRAALPAAAPVPLGEIKLVAYSGCDDLLSGLRDATARNVTPWGLDGTMLFTAVDRADASGRAAADASTAAPSHSTTNVHEAGVDEPDLIKTDGRRIVTYARGVLRVVDAETKKETGSLRLVPAGQGWAGADLLIHGDRALVLAAQGGMVPFGGRAVRASAITGPQYKLVDLKEMKLLGSLTVDGSHVDARMVGSTVRIVVRSQPRITFPVQGPEQKEDELLRRNREIVRAAPADAWLPAYEIAGPDGEGRQRKVACERVSHPRDYTGTSMLTVHTVDLAAGLDGDETISVAADGDTVYATPTSLYVTSNPRWWFRRGMIDDTVRPRTDPAPGAAEATVAPRDPASTPPAEKVEPTGDPSMPSLLPKPTGTVTPPASSPVATPSDGPEASTSPSPDPTTSQEPPEQTEIHRFDISGPGAPGYTASGAVPGRLLNQYSLSEYEGNLRVATTSSGTGGSDSAGGSSGVYVLDAGTLVKKGEVTGLGRGERIYSVRFIGPVGYVVTFRQVDPLYTLDLRDPAAPKVTGELKITGFSAYLHPAGDGRLLGIGQEASEEGRTQGTQISLFDVSDPGKPARLARYHQKNSGSAAEWDPHAFLYWPATGLAVVPLSSWGGRTDDFQTSALVLRVGTDSIGTRGTITHPKAKGREGFAPDTPTIQRCLVIGDTLWTLSDAGLKASDATTLTDQGWIPFEK